MRAGAVDWGLRISINNNAFRSEADAAGGRKIETICSQQWINPNDPLISRLPYSPVIGPRRREMKAGITYRCQRCGKTLTGMPYRVRGTIAEVCDVCAYPVESDQHLNHCRG